MLLFITNPTAIDPLLIKFFDFHATHFVEKVKNYCGRKMAKCKWQIPLLLACCEVSCLLSTVNYIERSLDLFLAYF